MVEYTSAMNHWMSDSLAQLRDDQTEVAHREVFNHFRRWHTRPLRRIEARAEQCWHAPAVHQQSNTDQQMSFRNR